MAKENTLAPLGVTRIMCSKRVQFPISLRVSPVSKDGSNLPGVTQGLSSRTTGHSGLTL